MSRLARWYFRLQHLLDRAWYIPAVMAIAVVNAFLPFIPVEIFVILRVLIRPREWWRAPVLVAGASALGALCLALAVGRDEHSAIATFLVQRLGQTSWDKAAAMLRAHGSWGLALVSVSFVPQQPAVVVAAVAGMPLWKIVLPIWLARSFKYGFYSALAAFAPHWILHKDHHEQIVARRPKD